MPAPALALEAKIRRDYEVQRRHLPRVLETARDLERFCALEEQHAREVMSQRLREAYVACFDVPFYRDRFASQGYGRGDVQSLDDLARLPMLARSDAAAHWTEFLALDASSDELCAVKSTGSTGEPLLALKDGYDQMHMWAALRFWLARQNIALPRRPRVCLLDALPGGLEYEARIPVLNDGELRRISTVRERALHRLAEFSPHVLFSDPAGLHWLSGIPARQDRAHGTRDCSIVLSSAQYFAPESRRDFMQPILNYYSLTETGPVAWECLRESGVWHVMAPDLFAESCEGEIVVTRLRQSALPLIRYRTGDSGQVAFRHCACGTRGYAITRFEGRRQCWFVNDAGLRVDAWQFAWLFKQFALTEFRMTQQAGSVFLVELPPTVDAPALKIKLEAALVALGWANPQCRFAHAPRINGPLKPRPFVPIEGARV